MAGWPRRIRAMLGTGVTFAAGVTVVGSIVAAVVMLAGEGSFHETFGMVGRFAVVSFVLGVAFSALLALTARSRRLAELSVPRFAALGGGAGLLYFLLLALNAYARWSVSDAIANLVILTVLGSGSATAILLLARRGGRPELEPGAEPRSLGDAGEVVGGVAARRERTKV